MPSASGVYSLPPGYLAITGTTIQASQHNPPLEDIAAALTLRLSRDGTAPMSGPIQLTSGTVALPGGVFAADPTSGFYKTTAGIGVAIGGVKVAEFVAGGVIGARVLGELVPFTGSTAPSSLWQLPFGQTLSRTTYSALWAFAQIEIAAGNTLYNNGDGSTTFGIPDMRGRVPFAWDKIGGSASGRLTTAGGGVDGTTLGAVGGGQNVTLLQANFPSVNFTVAAATTTNNVVTSSSGLTAVTAGGTAIGMVSGSDATGNISVSGTAASGGSGTPLKIMPPAIVTNYLLFAGGVL